MGRRCRKGYHAKVRDWPTGRLEKGRSPTRGRVKRESREKAKKRVHLLGKKTLPRNPRKPRRGKKKEAANDNSPDGREKTKKPKRRQTRDLAPKEKERHASGQRQQCRMLKENNMKGKKFEGPKGPAPGERKKNRVNRTKQHKTGREKT